MMINFISQSLEIIALLICEKITGVIIV